MAALELASVASAVVWVASTSFLAFRVGLYVFLVSLAWYGIIEEHLYPRVVKHKSLSKGRPGAKTSPALAVQTAAATGRVPVVKTQLGDGITTTQVRSPQGPNLRADSLSSLGRVSSDLGLARPSGFSDVSSITDTDSSMAGWTIWDDDGASSVASSDAESDAEDAADDAVVSMGPGHAAAAATESALPPYAPRAPPRHLRPRVHHPVPVTVTAVPTPVEGPLTPKGRAAATHATAGDAGGGSDLVVKGAAAMGGAGAGAEVVPAAVGAAGATREDAELLEEMGASLAGGDIIKEPPKETVKQTRHGKKKEKKPFLTRKLEKYVFKPVHDKYEKVGFMTYKGFSRMGRRMERGMRITGAQVSVAMNNAGVAALDSVDHLIKKWVMFIGLMVGLSVALLPMPSSVRLDVHMVP